MENFIIPWTTLNVSTFISPDRSITQFKKLSYFDVKFQSLCLRTFVFLKVKNITLERKSFGHYYLLTHIYYLVAALVLVDVYSKTCHVYSGYLTFSLFLLVTQLLTFTSSLARDSTHTCQITGLFQTEEAWQVEREQSTAVD